MNYIKNIVKPFAVVLMLFLSIGVFAQINKTAGTRITDVTTDKELNEAAILDLDSSTRGFYMPRMNTTQRDQLGAKLIEEKTNNGKENTGISIYNTTTDCIEYWHGATSKWRSLCGSLPPAKLDLLGGCSNISFSESFNAGADNNNATWQQGRAMDGETDFITIRVYVSQIGTYQITADSGNGYFFTAEGQFQAEGNYFVVLKGMGAPKVGYKQDGGEQTKKGDVIKFVFNGVESKECPAGKTVKVTPANMKLKFVREVYEAAGTYNVGVEAKEDNGNFLKVKVEVAIPGTAEIKAVNEALGLGFIKVVEFDRADTFEVVLTPMSGKLMPNANDAASYDLKFDVNVPEEEMTATLNGATAIVKVAQTEISIDPAKVDFGKEPFYQGTPINAKNILTVPVKVVGSGKATLKLKSAEGIEFEAKDVVFNKLDNANDYQYVTFKPIVTATTLPEADSSVFTLSGTGARFAITGTKDITVPLAKKPVGYTISCDEITTNRGAIPYQKAVGESYIIKVPVNVTEKGEYEIYTKGTADGVTFSSNRNGAKLKFDTTGPQVVELYPVDPTVVPNNRGTYDLIIASRDGSGNADCSTAFKAIVGYNDINILLIKAIRDSENTGGTEKFFTGKNSSGKYRFGVDGEVVQTGDVSLEVLDNFQEDNNPNNEKRTRITKEIIDGKYNLIIVEGMYAHLSIPPAMEDAIYDYATKRNGAVVYGLSNGSAKGKTFFNYLINIYVSRGEMGEYQRKDNKLLYRMNNGAEFPLSIDRRASKIYEIRHVLVDKNYKYLKPIWNYNYNGYNLRVDYQKFGYSTDASASRFKAITTDNYLGGGEKGGAAYVHSDYPRFFFFPVFFSYRNTYMNPDGVSKEGEVNLKGIDPGYYQSDQNILFANLFSNLLYELANE